MLAEQKENDEIVSNLLKENYVMKDEIRGLHNELKVNYFHYNNVHAS